MFACGKIGEKHRIFNSLRQFESSLRGVYMIGNCTYFNDSLFPLSYSLALLLHVRCSVQVATPMFNTGWHCWCQWYKVNTPLASYVNKHWLKKQDSSLFENTSIVFIYEMYIFCFIFLYCHTYFVSWNFLFLCFLRQYFVHLFICRNFLFPWFSRLRICMTLGLGLFSSIFF